MTVADLIAELQNADPNATVEYDGDDMYDSYPVQWVEFAGAVVRLH